MNNRDLVKDLKERIEIQIKDCATVSKLDTGEKKFEQGFIRGYISSINYTVASLKKNNIISLEEFIELNTFIAENLDKIKVYE